MPRRKSQPRGQQLVVSRDELAEFDEWKKARDEAREADRIDKALAERAAAAIKDGNDGSHDPARGPKGIHFDPFDLVAAMGFRERPAPLSYAAMASIGHGVPVIADIVRTRVNQVAMFCRPPEDRHSTGFEVRRRDWKTSTVTRATEKRQEELATTLLLTGHGDVNKPWENVTLETFARSFVSDSLVFDQSTFELVPARDGTPSYIAVVDPTTIRLIDPGTRSQGDPFAVQVVAGAIVTDFTQDELAFCVRNPRSGIRTWGYGQSEIETLVREITGLLFAIEYNKGFFLRGAATKGILNFKGTIPDRHLQAFRRQWYAQVAGVSNCVAGSTVIWTRQRGAVALRDLLARGNQCEVLVWTGEDWRTALAYKTDEPKRLCRTKLANGAVVETSPDHRFRVIGDDGLPTWKAQADLSLGDYVLVNRRSWNEPAKSIPTFGENVLTPEIAEIMGWLAGDGTLRFEGRGHQKNNKISLFYHHEKERDLRDRHCAALQAFGVAAISHDREVPEEEAARLREQYGFKSIAPVRRFIRICQVEFVEWLVGLGFPSHGHGVPGFIHAMPEEFRCAFLRGLFSADGNCGGRRNPHITLADSTMREQTRMLLASLGIRTSCSQGKRKWTIEGRERGKVDAASYLSVKDRSLFFERIGFLQAHKQPLPLAKPNEDNKCSRIPRSVYRRFLFEVREANRASGFTLLTFRQRLDLNSILTEQDGCGLARMIRFMELAHVPVPDWLRDYWFEPVVDLETTDEIVEMYDLSVYDERHQFMANGVATHNSWRTPITNAEELQWINMQMSNRDMEYGHWLDWLTKVCCARFNIAPEEIQFQYGNSGQSQAMGTAPVEEKIKASKDLGLRPLVRWFFSQLNTYFLQRIDSDFEAIPVGLEARGEEAEAELLKNQTAVFLTVDEARESAGLEPLGEGKGDVILNPTWLQYVQAQQMAQQQPGGSEGMPGEDGAEEPPSSPDAQGAADEFPIEREDENPSADDFDVQREPMEKGGARSRVVRYVVDLDPNPHE